MNHPMVRLGERLDWAAFEKTFAAMWHDTHGRPAIETRLMVSLHGSSGTTRTSSTACMPLK